MKKMITFTALTTAAMLMATSASALVIDGNSVYGLNDGAVLDTNITDAQSDFANEFAISSDTTDVGGVEYSTGTITLADIGIEGGSFQFFYDSQETGNARDINIDDILISVDGIDVWGYSGTSLAFNTAGAVPTDSPLGNGADAILNIPFDVFLGNGFTSDSVLTFNWLQMNDNNGADEWVVADGGNNLMGPIDPPVVAPVPLPAGLPLLLAGLGGLMMTRRKS